MLVFGVGRDDEFWFVKGELCNELGNKVVFGIYIFMRSMSLLLFAKVRYHIMFPHILIIY